MKKYKRILLKISGEVFAGEEDKEKKGISFLAVEKIARILIKIKQKHKGDLVIVIGGGNIFRGRDAIKFDRVAADNIGMLATVINGLALQETLRSMDVSSKVLTPISLGLGGEAFSKKAALIYLKKGEILIFVGGTGNPFFSTDSAAALRACELECDLILKATNVDGVYDKNPNKYNDAKLYEKISHDEVLIKNLEVMDSTAFALCRDNKKPIVVFNIKKIDQVVDFLNGKIELGTLVS